MKPLRPSRISLRSQVYLHLSPVLFRSFFTIRKNMFSQCQGASGLYCLLRSRVKLVNIRRHEVLGFPKFRRRHI